MLSEQIIETYETDYAGIKPNDIFVDIMTTYFGYNEIVPKEIIIEIGGIDSIYHIRGFLEEKLVQRFDNIIADSPQAAIGKHVLRINEVKGNIVAYTEPYVYIYNNLEHFGKNYLSIYEAYCLYNDLYIIFESV